MTGQASPLSSRTLQGSNEEEGREEEREKMKDNYCGDNE